MFEMSFDTSPKDCISTLPFVLVEVAVSFPIANSSIYQIVLVFSFYIQLSNVFGL
jgi:hypothetical protein